MQEVSDRVERTYQDRLKRIRYEGVRTVLSLCLAEVDSILQNPEQTDFGNESYFRHRDEFHELMFWHNGREDEVWEGLRCNRFYLNPDEYRFIVNCRRLHPFSSVVESGCGETSVLFRRLGCEVLSIEWQQGPWVERAAEAGARVKLVHFDVHSAEFDRGQLESALRGQSSDLLFVDSPVGSRNRSNILESFCRYLEPRFILIHDAYRDARNVYRWMRTFDLKVLEYLSSWRGLLFLEKRNSSMAVDTGSRG